MSNIMDKLKKLITLQISAEKIGNIHEAANAASRVQDLLIKHNISMDEINLTESTKTPVGENIIPADDLDKKNEGEWLWVLLTGIARGYLCKPIINTQFKWSGSRQTKVKTHITIVGKPDNTEIVMYLFDQLQVRIREMAKNSWKEYIGIEKKNSYIRAFYTGCASAIKNRLVQDINKKQGDTKDIQTSGLILRNDTALDEYIAAKIGVLTNLKLGSKVSARGGYLDGKKAGEGIDLHKGVQGNKSNHKQIG